MSQLAFYYFQGELGESMQMPNAFQLPKSAQTTFDTFVKYFPIRSIEGFYFRFREEDSVCGFVWRDINSPSSVLPVYKGAIFAKIIKIDNNSSFNRKIRLQRKPDCFWGGNGAIATNLGSSNDKNQATIPSEQSIKNSSSKSDKPVPQAEIKPHPANKSVTRDLIDDSNYQNQNTNYSNSAKDILEFSDSNQPQSIPSKNNSVNNIDIGIDTSSVNKFPVLNREALAARREANVNEKVKEALEFKLELDEKQRIEAQELDEAKAKYDKNLTIWASSNNEKKNIRNLLTSMHTVLWQGSDWKPVSLGDVIESKKVKLYYRKAMLVVHPDKCSSLNSETKFIAKRIFEAVNEAYQEFLKKEGL